MRRLAAVLHTLNDGLRVGRCLETLYPCDEILIIDQGSTDQTLRIAREYGARIVRAEDARSARDWFTPTNAAWLLCLDPRESLTEGLAASLFEWKSQPSDSQRTEIFSILVREERSNGWLEYAEPQTRLVPWMWQRWNGPWPAVDQPAPVLKGAVLRFSFP